MPPKQGESSKKRKTAKGDDASDAEGVPKRQAKKAKAAASTNEQNPDLAPNGQPTNKVLPVTISFPARLPATLRMATWNVCGLSAAQKKGFKFYVEAEDPDILVLTETKVNSAPDVPFLDQIFPHRYWAIAEKKGSSGTAVLSKHKPLSVCDTLPGHPNQNYVKGRIITLEFPNSWFVGTYVVNAGEKLKTLKEKEEWNTHFETYIRDLDAKKPVIWTGDLNVAPTSLDLKNDKTNWNKTPGYTESETKAFARILNGTSGTDASAVATHPKFVDVWRRLHPTEEHYTYFSYRFNCRTKGIGWRLDLFVLSERLMERVKMCEIRSEIYGASDHCPVVMEIEGSL